MISAVGLTRNFGHVVAVDSLDFDIAAGQVVGFLGPNGAGKTTTIRMIAGFLPPTAGTALVDGMDVVKDPLGVRRRLGYLAETAPLYGEMRVSEYLQFRGRLFGLDRAARRAASASVAGRCGLASVLRRPIHQLSRGYRQRVGLAAALLHDPPVLILDEPTVGLDPAQIAEVRRLIRDLAGDHTILLSSHILPEVEVTCDRLLMIARGRIRAQGTVEELRATDARLGKYIVETSSSSAQRAIEELPDVIRVESMSLDGPWRRLTVTARPESGDLREAVAGKLAPLGSPIRELRRQSASLEHLFVQMMADAEAEVATGRNGAASPLRERAGEHASPRGERQHA